MTTPFGDPSDEIVIGSLGEQEIAFVSRHGAGHRFSPTEVPYRANLHALKQLGVTRVISVSAVGSMKEEIAPGHVVLPAQYIDRTVARPRTFFDDGIVAHVAFAEPICEELRQLVSQSARHSGARIHDGGTYVNMEGPAFSTRAESLANHRMGFDVIGMTNLGEAKCAREAEIAYATMAMVTDYDCWKTDEAHVTVEMIVENLHKNAARAKAIIAHLTPRIPTEANWPCHSALKNSILTDKKLWPEKTRRELRSLLKKYL